MWTYSTLSIVLLTFIPAGARILTICIFHTDDRMAFNTNQSLDNILLRNISFRTHNNAAISSTYTLYANGAGQTYWCNSVNPDNLSTLSTSISVSFQTMSSILSTNIGSLYSDISTLEQSTLNNANAIETTTNALYSSVTQLLIIDEGFSNAIDDINSNYQNIANDLSVQINNIYTSTVNFVESTLFATSTFVTFYDELSLLQSSIEGGLASTNTEFNLQNTSTYNSLTANYTLADAIVTTNANLYTDNRIAYISSITTKTNTFSTFSSIITNQLLSTSVGLSSVQGSTNKVMFGAISTLYYSSIIPLNSTTKTNTVNISSLLALSTNLYSTTYTNVSTIGSTLLFYGTLPIYNQLSTQSTNISYLLSTTSTLSRTVNTLSTQFISSYYNQSSINGNVSTSLYALQYDINLLTTSSLISTIYNSFIALEAYTVEQINNISSANSTFQYALYESTVAQNQSISQAFYNSTFETILFITQSTVLASTQEFVSTTLYELFSTSDAVLVSTIESTAQALYEAVVSTTSSVVSIALYSTGVYIDSTIQVVTDSLSTFSTVGFISISTFEYYAYSSVGVQSSMFNDIYTSTTTLYVSSSTLFGEQISTQSGLFDSSILIYNSTAFSIAESTNTAVLQQTSTAASFTLQTIESTTTGDYTTYTNNLNAALSTIYLSSLWTNSTINVTGTQFTSVMDMITYRNFFINIYDISTGSSNYILDYNSNDISYLDYHKGMITVNVSTAGQAYGNYNGNLIVNLNRGLTSFAPFISSSVYTLQYEYTLINSVAYTNLVNIFSRTYIQDISLNILSTNIYINGIISQDSFLRGTPIGIDWTPILIDNPLIPNNPMTAPDVEISLTINNIQYARYFSPFAQSCITVLAPYLTSADVANNSGNPVFSTIVRVSIAGSVNEAVSTIFNTIVPAFTSLQMIQSTGQYLGGKELVGISDSGQYPLFNIPYTIQVPVGAPNTYLNNPDWTAANLFNSILNTTGYVGATPQNITEGDTASVGYFSESYNNYPDFTIHIENYFEPLITLKQYLVQIYFTLSTLTTSYSFAAVFIEPQLDGSFRIYNDSITKNIRLFSSGESVNITYSYSLYGAIPDYDGLFESTFRGPTVDDFTELPPDYATVIATPLSLLPNDLLSTLIFYNLTDDPINSTMTAGTIIEPSFTYNSDVFSIQVTTTTDTIAQVFTF